MTSSVPDLDSGDVLLMNRKCLSMKDPLSIGLCLGAKSVSPYDHVGMLYKAKPEVIAQHPAKLAAVNKSGGFSPSGQYILESNVGGVTLRSLETRLKRTTCNEIAVRRLVVPNPDDRKTIQKTMDDVVNGVQPYQYKTNLIDFVAMSLKPPDKLDRMMAAKKMRILYNEIMMIRDEIKTMNANAQSRSRDGMKERLLEKLLTDYLDARRWLVDTYFTHLPQQVVDDHGLVIVDFDSKHLFFVDGENCSGSSKGVFCSELVVHTLQRSGVLKRFPPSSSYAPVDFHRWDDEFNFVHDTYGWGDIETIHPRQQTDPATTPATSSHSTVSSQDFVQQRLDILNSMYVAAGVDTNVLPLSPAQVVKLPHVVPSRWLIQSTTHYQLVQDLPERIMMIGGLFSLAGLLLAPLHLQSMEKQVGMLTVRGNLWTLGLALAGRSLIAASIQSWLTYVYLRRHAQKQPDHKDFSKVMRHRDAPVSSTADDRHPFYTTSALLVSCGAIGGMLTHALERRAMYYHFGPDRPAPPSLRSLFRGAPLSAAFFTFSYGGGWLVWYECFGPLYFTTETSVCRRRVGFQKDDRWTVQQRDAILGAMAVTLGVETVLYPFQSLLRRRFIREMYSPEHPPVKRAKLFAGFAKHFMRSCGVCATTGIVVWNWLL